MESQVQTETNVQQAVPFFNVKNIEESVRFYIDGLGFEMSHRWIDEGKLRWCWLKHGGAGLMLQEYHKNAHHQNSGQPEGILGLGVSVCFMCQDALAIYHQAKARGVEAKRPFVGNGLWVVSFLDPDGYKVEFESPTDVPEETEYSES